MATSSNSKRSPSSTDNASAFKKLSDYIRSSNPVSKTYVLRVFFVLVIARLLLSLLPQSDIDPGCYMYWGNYLNHYEFSNFYKDISYAIYGPIFPWMMWFLWKIAHFFSFENDVFKYGYLLKMLYVLFDFIGAYIIYKIGKNFKKERLGLILACFYVLNPGIFMNSSVWGQLDTMINTMILLSVYLFSLKKTYSGAAALMFGILIKPQAGILVLPVFFYFIMALPWKEYRTNFKGFLAKASLKTVLTLLLCIIMYTVAFFPFYNENLPPKPHHSAQDVVLRDFSDEGIISETADFFLWLPSRYFQGVDLYPGTASNSFNLWFLLGKQNVHYDTPYLGATYKFYGTLIFFTFVIFMGLFLAIELFIKKRRRVLPFYFAPYFITLCFFTFYTGNHERYLISSVIFSTVCIFWDKRFWIITGLVSLSTFINQFYIYLKLKTPNPWVAPDDTIGMVTSVITLVAAIYSVYVLFTILAKNKHEIVAFFNSKKSVAG